MFICLRQDFFREIQQAYFEKKKKRQKKGLHGMHGLSLIPHGVYKGMRRMHLCHVAAIV